MPSPSTSSQRQLAAARRRATHTRKALTELPARFALAADAAPGEALETVFNSVAVLLGDAAEDHRTQGGCLACRHGEDCPLVGVTDAFLPEGWVTA